MRYYYRLQFQLLNRHISDFGLHPLAGWLISISAFAAFSHYLFLKTGYASYIYVLIALSFVFRLSDTRRNDFLQFVFPKKKYLSMRVTENCMIILPFLMFMVIQKAFLPCLALFVSSVILAFPHFRGQVRFTVPTPFYRKPFEFILGFRQSFFVLVFAIFLVVTAVVSDNFNLGVFSLLLIFMLSMSYYFNPENEYFVWIHNLAPREFLIEKIKISLLHSTLLSLPITLFLCFFFFEDIYVVLGLQLISYIYLGTMILAKYSRFPGQINLPETVAMALSLWFPPILLAIMPYFYTRSVKRLKQFLE